MPADSPDQSRSELIDLAYDAGLRVLQLSYNVQDVIARGCAERAGGGVSELGARLIATLNERGVLVDTSHCSRQTVLDACRLSERRRRPDLRTRQDVV